MNKKEQLIFIQKELEAILEEFDSCLNQLNILKPFIIDLISITKGKTPRYKLSEKTEVTKK